MNGIVFQIDNLGRRFDKNWNGRFYGSEPDDSIWLYIMDDEGKGAPLQPGDHIHYSSDTGYNEYDYVIVKKNDIIFQVRRLEDTDGAHFDAGG